MALEEQQYLEPSMKELFNKLWACDTTPKSKHFMWSCLTNSLVVSFFPDEGRSGVEWKQRLQLFPWILWRLWKVRNGWLFSNEQLDAQLVVDHTLRDYNKWTELYKDDTTNQQVQPRRKEPDKWSPPQAGTIIWNGGKTYPRLISCLEAEVTSLSWVLNCIDNLGYEKVCFESDSSILMFALTDPQEWLRLGSFSTKSLKQQRQHLKLSFRSIRLSSNVC